MAPIKDETVDSLKDLVHKLQSRVEQLEARLEGSDKGNVEQSKGDSPSVRMILMGPPGAGMLRKVMETVGRIPLIRVGRQRNSSAKNKRQVLRLPSGTLDKP